MKKKILTNAEMQKIADKMIKQAGLSEGIEFSIVEIDDKLLDKMSL